jgi:glycosyltransferase involved in cell wall biosynthesis
MRIGVDIECLSSGRAGIAGFTENVVRQWQRPEVPHEVVLLTYEKSSRSKTALRRLLNGLRHLCWIQVELPRWVFREKCDLLFSPNYHTPWWRPCPSVLMIYDMIPSLFPEKSDRLNLWYRKTMGWAASRSASRVVTISECSRRDIARIFRLPKDRIEVVPLGVGDEFRAGPPAGEKERRETLLRQYGLREVRYILFVGTVEPRKNLPRLLDAYAMILASGGFQDLKLVLAGGRGWKENVDEAVLKMGLEGRVIRTGYVPQGDLPFLYRGASVFVFPSLYEGFGLPVLEAMACGVPVVASRTSSIPEVAGDAAELVDPTDAQAIAGAVVSILKSPARHKALVQKGRERASLYSWEKTAVRLLSVFETVRGRGAH